MSERESTLSPEFAQQLFEFGTRHTAAIYWHVPDDDLGRRVKANGSIFFVGFAKRIFGITADHVLNRYLEHLKEHSDLECQVGCLKYSPEQHIIDRSPEADRDLAVLEFRREDLAYIERSPWHLTARPAETLERGNPAVMFGFPGEVRRQRGENIRWIHLGAVGEATDVGLHFEPDCLVRHPSDQEVLDSIRRLPC